MPELVIADAAAQLRARLDECERIWVSVHEAPDGDSIGSALALYGVLRKLGKQVIAVRQPPFPRPYETLAHAGEMVDVDRLDTVFRPQMVIAVDVGAFKRVGAVADAVGPETIVVNIDHHPGSPGIDRPCRLLNLLDTGVASTTMLTYLLLQQAYPGLIGRDEATALYLGLVTDTGCFRHSNTNAAALRVGAELAELGADVGSLAEEFMFRRRPESLRLLAAVLGSLETHAEGRFVTLLLTTAMLDATGGRLDETEGFVNYASSLEGVHAAALFREVDSGTTKVSLRASGRLDVARVANEFGGGGHRNAAGLTMQAGLAATRARILEATLRHLGTNARSPVA
jgi:phosphoesterase RecJ-like protein